jgi:hypothetical protein
MHIKLLRLPVIVPLHRETTLRDLTRISRNRYFKVRLNLLAESGYR